MLQVIHDCYKIELQLARDVVTEVSRSLSLISNIAIQLPSNPSKMNAIKNSFQAIHELENVIGVIQNIHIPVKGGIGDAEFLNANKWHSLNFQLLFDDKMNVMSMRWMPGSMDNDSFFEKSPLCRRLKNDEFSGVVVLADESYSCREYLLTPVQNPTMLNEKLYNQAHSSTFAVGNEAVNKLVGRFPVLKLKTALDIDSMILVVKATMVLHNSLKDLQVPKSKIYSIFTQPNLQACSSDRNCTKRDFIINSF